VVPVVTRRTRKELEREIAALAAQAEAMRETGALSKQFTEIRQATNHTDVVSGVLP
jgi:hypothetical protein